MIGELDWRFNDERYSWVAQDDWTYSRVITLPHTPALLVCDGLMTLATVVLDGKVLGEANNQYRRWLFPLPTTPSQDPQNATLELRFHSTWPFQPIGNHPGHWHKKNASVLGLRQEYLSWGDEGIEDYAMMSGTFPQGPWLPTYVVEVPSAAIVDIVPRILPRSQSPKSGSQAPLADGNNTWDLQVTVHLWAPRAQAGVLSMVGDWPQAREVHAAVTHAAGQSIAVTLNCTAENVNLWWPNGCGRAKLFRHVVLSASLT